MRNYVNLSATIAASLIATQAHANLMLNTNVTTSFNGDRASTNTQYNDWSRAPDDVLYFGQLGATANGIVDFYYIGNEAGYTNSLVLNGTNPAEHSTAALPDVFTSWLLVGSVDVIAQSFVDFGFCTSGGTAVGGTGYCAWNANSQSLIDQFNYGNNEGYRSIGFRPLTGTAWASDLTQSYADWGLFWDDSGAANDDNHDDYIAIARFRAHPVSVPEPATSLLLGAGLLGLALTRRSARHRKA